MIKDKKNNWGVVVIIIIFILVLTQINNIRSFFNFATEDRQNGLYYDGYIKYNQSVKLNNISYTLPTGFEDHSTKINISAKYKGKDKNGYTITCNVNVQVIGNYEGTEDLAKGMSNYHNTNYELVNVNNINWYNLKYESTLNKDIYLTTYKDNILMYEYSGTKSCMPYSTSIINSIKISD